MIYFITILIVACIMLLIGYKPIIRIIAEKKAIPKLEKVLFSNSMNNRSSILEKFQHITKKRLNDNLMIDYFFKLKGLQVLNINKPMNFWLKVYLTTPTKIKLNYFEQVQFYETFLNDPKTHEEVSRTHHNDSDSKINIFKTSVNSNIANRVINQKFA